MTTRIHFEVNSYSLLILMDDKLTISWNGKGVFEKIQYDMMDVKIHLAFFSIIHAAMQSLFLGIRAFIGYENMSIGSQINFFVITSCILIPYQMYKHNNFKNN